MSERIAMRCWIEIDTDRVRDNARQLIRAASPCKVMAMVKANAYGMGAPEITRVLEAEQIHHFGVASLQEALEIKTDQRSVQIMGSMLAEEIEEAIANDISLTIDSLANAQRVSEIASRLKKTAMAHVIVDTGMGRQGIPVSEAYDVIHASMSLPNVHWQGIYSHFPEAIPAAQAYSHQQLHALGQLIAKLENEKRYFTWIHIANSDAVNNIPQACMPPFNAVRIGINLYGPFDIQKPSSLGLRPAIRVKSRLTAVRRLNQGSFIGYGRTHRLSRDTLVGTVAAGYADGIPLAFSNRGAFLVKGATCPILGRISMDCTNIALDAVDRPEAGDTVICMDACENSCASMENWADLKQTHPYDILCSLGTRPRRIYLP